MTFEFFLKDRSIHLPTITCTLSRSRVFNNEQREHSKTSEKGDKDCDEWVSDADNHGDDVEDLSDISFSATPSEHALRTNEGRPSKRIELEGARREAEAMAAAAGAETYTLQWTQIKIAP